MNYHHLPLTIFLVSLLFPISSGNVRANEPLSEAKKNYLTHVGLYRTAYNNYVIKKEVAERSGTFAAQEDFVVNARDMLVTRSMVWWYYFEALRIHIQSHSGIDEAKKTEFVTPLQSEQQWLMEHKDLTEAITIKSDLAAEANRLNDKHEEYLKMSYKILMSIKVADMRRAKTSIEALGNRSRLAVESQIRDPLSRDTRLRGFGELESLLASSVQEIDLQETQFTTYGSSMSNATGYEQLTQKLMAAYGLIGRAHALIRELSNGIEL